MEQKYRTDNSYGTKFISHYLFQTRFSIQISHYLFHACSFLFPSSSVPVSLYHYNILTLLQSIFPFSSQQGQENSNNLQGCRCISPREKCATDILYQVEYNLNIIIYNHSREYSPARIYRGCLLFVKCPSHCLQGRNYGTGKIVGFPVNDSVGIYLLKINNRNTGTGCEICLKLKIKTPERRQKVTHT